MLYFHTIVKHEVFVWTFLSFLFNTDSVDCISVTDFMVIRS